MADFLVFVTVQPSAKPQQMMHRNGKKNAVSRRTTRDFRKKQRKHLVEYIMAELLLVFFRMSAFSLHFCRNPL